MSNASGVTDKILPSTSAMLKIAKTKLRNFSAWSAEPKMINTTLTSLSKFKLNLRQDFMNGNLLLKIVIR